MASFTDQISTFNPYIQQLPTEAMVQVGMQKQAQYNQGVQKVQGYIDNVAGMDVLRPQDKEYMQSKLNELGNNLKSVAAGDFSNQQLVNSVGGMATNIVKDPIIKAATYSASLDKKNLAQMEADRKEGKLASQDEWLYTKQRNAYLSNDKLTDEKGNPIMLNSQYEKTVDADKIIADQLKLVENGKYTAEQIFVTNSDGTIQKDINGVPKLSEYTVKTIKEGKLPQNVISAIQTAMDRPDVQKALAVRGMYEYRGYDNAEEFAGYLGNQALAANKDLLTSLNAQKMDYLKKANSASNSDEKGSYELLASKMDDKINNINKEATNLRDIYKQYGDRNLDALKASIYQKKITSNYLNMFNPSISETYEKSAPYEAQQQKIKQDFDMAAKRAEIAISQGNLDVARGHLKIAGRAQTLAEKKFEKEYPDAPVLPQLEPIAGTFPAYATFLTKQKNDSDLYDDTKRNFVQNYYLALHHSQGEGDDKKIIAEFNKQVADNPRFLDQQVDIAKDAVTKNQNSTYYAGLVQQLPALNAAQRQVQLNAHKIEELEKDPRVAATSGDIKQFEQQLGGNRTVSIEEPTAWYQDINPFSTPTKKTFNITPNDLLNIATASRTIAPGTGEASSNKLIENARKAVEAKFGMPYDHVRQQFYGYRSEDGGITPATVDPSTISALSAATNIITSGKHRENIAAKEAVLKDKMIVPGTQGFSVYTQDAKGPEIKSTDDRIKGVLSKYSGVMDVTPFDSALAGPEADRDKTKLKVTYDPEADPKEAWSLKLFESGKLQKVLPISKEDAIYINSNIAAQPTPSQTVTQMKWGNGSTNSQYPDPTNPNAYKTAWYPSNIFSDQGRPDIVGADIKDHGTGRPTVWFYQTDASGKIIPIPFNGNFVNTDAAETFVKLMDATLLNQVVPVKNKK
jgi:hypothetical protein